MPSPVSSPVFSLAGSQIVNRATVPAPFRDSMPLGVRFFSIVDAGERWVTRFIDDIEYRSVVPGGFASATITLRLPRGTGTLADPDPLGFSRLVELFTRIQVVDLRSAEVAWEGRIEDPARQVDPDTWQIGALGSMIAATDIQRPVFYVDSSMDRWLSGEPIDAAGNVFNPGSGGFIWNTSRDDSARLLATSYLTGYQINSAAAIDYSWRWDSHGYDQSIARFTTTHSGTCSNATEKGTLSVVIGIAANGAIDVTAFTAGTLTKANVIGTDYTDANARYIMIGVRRSSGFTDMTSDGFVKTRLSNSKVVGMRQNRSGTRITTAANYLGDYVTVSQVVEDVIGRFLVGGWYDAFLNTPWPGSVRSTDAYVDSSDATRILHLVYPDGATAADILNDLADQVQTNAYWAIWESAWKAGAPSTDFGVTSGWRFEWTTWPNNWGYVATSQDGFEGQPNGADLFNFVFYRYIDTGDATNPHVTTAWHVNEMAPELLTGGFTRAVTVNKTDATTGAVADSLRDTYLASKRKVVNAGTLTVKRPIQFYDAGGNGFSGGSRMLDPWMIRPGKLVRITDLPPRAGMTDMAFGATPPNETLNGTIFRVVATDYSSSDNSCRMSLDQVTRWQIPTQISRTSGAGKTVRIR